MTDKFTRSVKGEKVKRHLRSALGDLVIARDTREEYAGRDHTNQIEALINKALDSVREVLQRSAEI